MIENKQESGISCILASSLSFLIHWQTKYMWNTQKFQQKYHNDSLDVPS